MLKVNHISFSSSEGGAAIAARRLHLALRASGANSAMTVAGGQPGPGIQIFERRRTLRRIVEREYARHLRRKHEAQAAGLLSLAMVQSGLGRHLNGQSRQILNLHWVNSDFMSIPEIGGLSHPVVWTMHDMWPFCGAEHYTEGHGWQDGYQAAKPGTIEALKLRVWKKKRKFWKRPFHIVAPSQWLADCARESALMRNWPTAVIPNAIDTETWRPASRAEARARLGLPADVEVVGFGAMGGGDDPRKGFRYLQEALSILRETRPDVRALVFGADAHDADLPFPVHIAGKLADPEDLRMTYACADVFALPSRQDNLPNTGVEALSCGIPIAGFQIGGLPDLVPNSQCGRLAKPFNAQELAQCIDAVLEHQVAHRDQRITPMGAAAREHAVRSYAFPVVARQYAALYEKISQAQP
ncbi:glycosyltransferase [Ruegeria arenilitoris]|uniref:glycosyltransferase n=1 Tax=Ruegeria arenilitoris TaxID=1173585 RepID=UPI001C2C1A5E